MSPCPRCGHSREVFVSHGVESCLVHGPWEFAPEPGDAVEEPAPIRDRVSAARTGRPWTVEDWAFVELHMEDMSAAEIGAVLGRTASGIHKRLRKAGLSKPHPPRKVASPAEGRDGERWTEEEDALLEDGLSAVGVRSMSLQLGRSERAVRKRIYEVLGVKVREDGFLSMAEVARLWRCPLDRVRRLVRDGELVAKRAGNRVRIDPMECQKVATHLRAEKATHKGSAPDVGDWAQRYGYERRREGGVLRWVERDAGRWSEPHGAHDR